MGGCLKSDDFALSSTLKFPKFDETELTIPFGFWISFFFIILSTGLVSYSRRQFAIVIHAEQMSQLHYIVTDASGAIISAILLSGVAWVSYNNPVWKRDMIGTAWRYLLLATVHSLLHAVGSASMRHLGFSLLNLEVLNPESWGDVFQTELPAQLFMSTVTIATVHGLLFFQRSNAEQFRLLKIEQQLTKERLRSLQGQLNPHFLFNTLNTISAMMYEDAVAADRMIERLSDLMRASFKFNSIIEVRLAEELNLVEAYTTIMQERFPDKFEVRVSYDESLNDVLVPPLLLQPLIENCFKHGRLDTLGEYGQKGLIELIIQAHDQMLDIVVIDNGDAHSMSRSSTISHGNKDSNVESHGLGLKITKRRLRLLYRDRYLLNYGERAEQRGYRVSIRFPLHVGEGSGRFFPSPLPTPRPEKNTLW